MIEIPLKIESTLNKREHWSVRAKRAKEHRWATRIALAEKNGSIGWPAPKPRAVKLTRIAPRLMDTDNLAGGFKSVRDGVADWLGINDNDPRVEWRYSQEKGKPKSYSIRIEFLATISSTTA